MVIMQNVSRIIKDNEKLRHDNDEKSKKIELLNERMTDLLTRNQQFFEQSNQLLATQTDSMQVFSFFYVTRFLKSNLPAVKYLNSS